jgi:hypothetical protein
VAVRRLRGEASFAVYFCVIFANSRTSMLTCCLPVFSPLIFWQAATQRTGVVYSAISFLIIGWWWGHRGNTKNAHHHNKSGAGPLRASTAQRRLRPAVQYRLPSSRAARARARARAQRRHREKNIKINYL